jgi:hypothetical protein
LRAARQRDQNRDMRTRELVLAVALAASAGPAAADEPARRFSFAAGGEASFTLSEMDRSYFNDLDYGHNALRLARLSLTGRAQAGRWAAVLADLRSENGASPRLHALYLSVHPLRGRPFDVQIGRIPAVFGAYPRRGYGPSEPLPGVPLPYQYLTTLRSDAVPAAADDLLRQRGRGWNVQYPVGNTAWDAGLPMVSAFQWDTGIQARLGSEGGWIEASAALTQGSLSHPVLHDDNRGKQLAGRIALRPVGGLVTGVSAARGQYLDRGVTDAVAALTGRREDAHQQAFGLDLEYSRGHGVLRAEAIWSRWEMPAVGVPRITEPLGAWGGFVEGHYRIAPGLTLGARGEWLRFDRIRGSDGTASWDAPVSRLETALAYAFHRQVIGKVAYQHNRRSAPAPSERHLIAGQLVLWF